MPGFSDVSSLLLVVPRLRIGAHQHGDVGRLHSLRDHTHQVLAPTHVPLSTSRRIRRSWREGNVRPSRAAVDLTAYAEEDKLGPVIHALRPGGGERESCRIGAAWLQGSRGIVLLKSLGRRSHEPRRPRPAPRLRRLIWITMIWRISSRSGL